MLKMLLALLVSSTTFAAEYVVRTTETSKLKVENLSQYHVHRQLKHFVGFTADLTPQQVSDLKALGYTVEVTHRMHVLGHPSKRLTISDTAPALPPIPWGTTAIHAPEANALSNGAGDGVTVCVVDTGAGVNEPDLQGVYVPGVAIVKTTATGQVDWYDDMGHGTHVSGTIAAKADPTNGVQGVAPHAKIFPVKVLDAQGEGTDADVADGIKACIGHAQLISMSLGGSETSAVLEDAVKAAQKAGLVVIAASGNDGGKVGYPAAYRNVVAVSAVDSTLKFADFSNFGPEIAWAAPGVGVRSTIPGGFDTWDGTSMATPHVAAVKAIQLARKKCCLKGVDINLKSDQQGKGLIDALKTAK